MGGFQWSAVAGTKRDRVGCSGWIPVSAIAGTKRDRVGCSGWIPVECYSWYKKGQSRV